jgi:sugar phosphate isomerase/epimerase
MELVMQRQLSRRCFFATSLTLMGAALESASVMAIDPLARNGPFAARLSLAAYSFREHITGKIQPKMTLFDVADKAAELGCAAFEPTAYYFTATDVEYLTKLKRHCTLLGLDISGGAIGNNFCAPEPDKLKKEIEQTKAWIERYSLLGAKTLRIFAGPLAKGDREEDARKRCIECIHQCCDHAARFGVILALENHGGIVATAEQMLAIVQAVKHDWFGVNLDTGNFRTEDPYGDLAKLAPFAVTVQLKVEVQKKGQQKAPADLPRLIDILRQVRYRGYVALEYEAADPPLEAIPRYVSNLKKLLH